MVESHLRIEDKSSKSQKWNEDEDEDDGDKKESKERVRFKKLFPLLMSHI